MVFCMVVSDWGCLWWFNHLCVRRSYTVGGEIVMWEAEMGFIQKDSFILLAQLQVKSRTTNLIYAR